MTTFILLSLIFLVYEFRILVNPSKFINLKKQLEDLKTLTGEQKKKRTTELLKDSSGIVILNLFYQIWCVVGLIIFTQWYLFAFIIFLSIFSTFMINQLIKLDRYLVFYKIFDSLLTIVILLMIMTYHFFPNFLTI